MAIDPLAARRNLAQHFTARRKALRWSQETVAAKAGVGLKTVRELESAASNVGFFNMSAVAKALGFESFHDFLCTPAPPVPVDPPRSRRAKR
jgi:transcriptional regulator with XRE-family HTH domain